VSQPDVVKTYLLAEPQETAILVSIRNGFGKESHMFLRRCKRRKNGKQHTYWALVESYRTAGGSRQRVVAYLGELKNNEESGWAQLGRRLDGRSRPQRSLFDPPHYDDPDDDEPVVINLKGVRLERLRDFGDVWLALGLWRLLGLDELLSGLMPEGREEVRWDVMAAILTIGRFCEPSSELHIEDSWYSGAALEDLLGVSAGLDLDGIAVVGVVDGGLDAVEVGGAVVIDGDNSCLAQGRRQRDRYEQNRLFHTFCLRLLLQVIIGFLWGPCKGNLQFTTWNRLFCDGRRFWGSERGETRRGANFRFRD